jgi:asparagine synthase (glutamine-hydrolysing)
VKEAESNIRNLLKNAVLKRIIHSDRKVGILCSGGVDSSIIACLVKELNICDMIHVFTMEYNNSNSEDTFYARLLCKKLGLQHTVFTFDNDDIVNNYDNVVRQCETYDPNTIRAAIPMYILAHKIAENTDVKVILSGEGADELFHGYNYFHMAPSPDLAQEESIRLLQNLHMFDLLRAERCFLSAGLEVRVPFLDKYLVEYILSLPGDLFNQPTLGIQFSEKELLRNTFKYMVDLESIRILTRPKERFSDGCGFTYIPTLLNFLSGGIVSKLNEKLNYEKKYVNNIFNANYPNCNHLIINRTMPFWTISGRPSNNDNGNILECI